MMARNLQELHAICEARIRGSLGGLALCRWCAKGGGSAGKRAMGEVVCSGSRAGGAARGRGRRARGRKPCASELTCRRRTSRFYARAVERVEVVVSGGG